MEDGVTLPARVFLEKTTDTTSTLKITIFEGRKRQVRRMCKAVGHPVLKLKRLKIGPVMLGNLKPSHFRFLTKKELKMINRITQNL